MKRFAALCLLIGTASALCFAQNEARLTFDIKGMAKGDTLCLSWGAINKSMNPFITQLEPKDDTLSLPLNEPRLVVLGVKGREGGYELLAAPGEDIIVDGRLHIDNTGKKPRAEFRKMKVRGARYQQTYTDIITNFVYHLDSLDTDVDQDFKGIKKIIFWAKRNNDEQAIADMYQTREGVDYIERVASNFKDRNQYLEQLISSHKDSFLGPMLMLRFYGRLTPEQRPLYEELTPEAQNSYYGREVREEVAPMSLQGSLAPTVSVENTEGEEKILSFAEAPGKLLLLDFWASWCQPCIKEISTLLRIYDEYHEKGLNIVSISADMSHEDWKAAIEELELPWYNFIDINQQAATEYGVKYIPSLFIVDSGGTIIAEKLRGYDLESFLSRYFSE
ncbi:MAG: TlpA family protein disulfide reductase [Prevotellaceae bacterium]|nr:TlpA family protein disulfide reductase [Prevotellaceae bacterium]MCD8303609.1 TlpA family protein disulfide reductase [Prevotellaceae bacterium]